MTEEPTTRISNLLQGKVAIVSGIGPGLGRQAALALAAHGADLVLGARKQASLDAVAEEVAAIGAKVVTRSTDITDQAQCDALAAAGAEAFGHVDVLVNNAFRFDVFQSFDNVDIDQWEKITSTNVFGTLKMCKAVVPHLKAAGGGSIVNIASMAARKPPILQGGYATSKGGLLTATKVLAGELGAAHIRVNAVVPGWMAGPSVDMYLQMTAQSRGISEEEVLQELCEPVPLGMIPSDREVAGTIVFLASSLSAAITGQAIDTNGGELMV